MVIEEFGDERVSKLSGGLLGVGLGEMEAQTLKESREQRWCLIYLELWTRKSLTSVNSGLNRAEKSSRLPAASSRSLRKDGFSIARSSSFLTYLVAM